MYIYIYIYIYMGWGETDKVRAENIEMTNLKKPA